VGENQRISAGSANKSAEGLLQSGRYFIESPHDRHSFTRHLRASHFCLIRLFTSGLAFLSANFHQWTGPEQRSRADFCQFRSVSNKAIVKTFAASITSSMMRRIFLGQVTPATRALCQARLSRSRRFPVHSEPERIAAPQAAYLSDIAMRRRGLRNMMAASRGSPHAQRRSISEHGCRSACSVKRQNTSMG